jgi:hypothetical protein
MLWLGIPKLYWVRVSKIDILVSLLTLAGMTSVVLYLVKIN